MWFDGYLDHFEMTNITLAPTFTLEFFLRNACQYSAVGSLFANYRPSYTYSYGSLFNFKIRYDRLAFTETSGLSLTSTGKVTLNEWSHVALTVDYDSSHTSIKFYIDGTLSG